jgi:hypothetical protein
VFFKLLTPKQLVRDGADPGEVCFGSLADIAASLPNVCFTPQKRTSFSTIVMSALCQKQTSRRVHSMTSSARNKVASASRVTPMDLALGQIELVPENSN